MITHDSSDSEPNEIVQLQEWIISCRISHSHSDKLLKLLRCRLLPILPMCEDTKIFLQSTSAEYLLENMENFDNFMRELYLGIA